MKKGLLWMLAIFIVIYLLFINIAPPIVDRSKNKVSQASPYKVSAAAKSLYHSLDFVGDLHCDALLWDRDLTEKADYGHVDFVRMQEHNVHFQTFTIVTKSPKGQNFTKNSDDAMDMITPLSIGQGQPIRTWFSLVNRALYQCQKLHDFADKSTQEFIVVKTKIDFQNLLNNGKEGIGGMLGIEGAHCLEGELDNFQKIYEAGVRMLGPTHFFDNEMGGSAHGIRRTGLTAFGKKVIQLMNEKNMILDVAHSSEPLIDDILSHFTGPILSSHTGVKGTKPSVRNLSDRHLQMIAARGGLVGIAFFSEAIGDNGVSGIVAAMRYTRDLIGIEHVALGSDFDGSVTTPFDITGLAIIVEELLQDGFTNQEISAIMGGNLKRFLLQNLPD